MDRWTRRAALGMGAVALSALLVAPTSLAAQQVELPEPTGEHEIGTTALHLVDHARQDPWHPDRKRELMVTVTYPARETANPRADWIPDGLAAPLDEAMSEALDVPRNSVSWQQTQRHARTAAPVDRRGGDRPVVLFSPGFGVPRELNAVLADDLASRGHVVVSLAHTHESLVEFPGGRVEPPVAQVGVPEHMRTAIDARVADTRFVLDQLGLLDLGTNPDADGAPLPPGLRGALDLDHVGMFGHSYGGFTAGETMVHDRRIDAGADLDGMLATSTDSPYSPGEVVRGLDRPFLLMGGAFPDPQTGQSRPHDHLPGNADRSWVDFWPNQRGWKRDLNLGGGAHHSFTDLQALVPQLGTLVRPDLRESLIGRVDPQRSLAAQHAYLGSFFDLHLRNEDDHLLDGPSPQHPEIAFVQ